MNPLKFLFGFSVGCAVGWMATILLTPQSGEEVREAIRNRVEEVIEEGRRAAEQRKAELEREFNVAKTPRPVVPPSETIETV